MSRACVSSSTTATIRSSRSPGDACHRLPRTPDRVVQSWRPGWWRAPRRSPSDQEGSSSACSVDNAGRGATPTRRRPRTREPADHDVGVHRAPLVLAHVLGPRRDDERLDEPIGVGEIAEQAPLRGAAAPPVATDPAHRRGELRLRRRHPIRDRTSTGPASGVGSRFTIGALVAWPVLIDGMRDEAASGATPRADHQQAGRDDVGGQDAPARDDAPDGAADRNRANQHDHVDAHAAGPHPPWQRALGRRR